MMLGGVICGYCATGRLNDGDAPGQGDDDRQHRGEDRPVDEEVREHPTLSRPPVSQRVRVGRRTRLVCLLGLCASWPFMRPLVSSLPSGKSGGFGGGLHLDLDRLRRWTRCMPLTTTRSPRFRPSLMTRSLARSATPSLMTRSPWIAWPSVDAAVVAPCCRRRRRRRTSCPGRSGAPRRGSASAL